VVVHGALPFGEIATEYPHDGTTRAE
jgi:hypothetical protein